MKKMRFLSAIVMLMMCVTAWAQSASYKVGDTITPESSDASCKGFTFKVLVATVDSDGRLTAEITKTTNSGTVTVPAYFKDKVGTQFHVSKVNFGSSTSLANATVILSEGIETLPTNAFSKTGVKSVTFPSTVKELGTLQLGTQDNLEEIIVSEENPYFMTDDDHTMLFQKDADGNPTGTLKAATTYKNVDGTRVAITEFTIPEGVKKFDNFAMSGAYVQKINLPTTFEGSGESLFASGINIKALNWVNVAEGNPSFCSIEGNVYSKDMTEFVYSPKFRYTSTDVLTIPETVTKIWNLACVGFQGKNVIFNNVETIGKNAFQGCSNLKELYLGDNVKTVGEQAFFDCGLTTVTMSDAVESIGDKAFGNCKKITEITIGKNVTNLGDGFLTACYALTKINVAEGNPNYASEDGILYNDDKTTLIICPGGRTEDVTSIPASTTEIQARAFQSCTKIKKVTIGENVATIGANAFSSMTQLEELDFGSSVTSLGNSVCSGCTALNKVTIGNNVTTVPSQAFLNCSSLATVEFEATSSVTKIETLAFGNTPLTSITIPASVETMQNNIFGPGLKEVKFEDGSNLTSLENSFEASTELCSVDFGNANPDKKLKLTKSFKGLTKLESVKLPCSLTTMSASVFDGCTSLSSVTFYDNENPVTIGDYCFRETAIKEITLPKNLQKIGAGAFNSCLSLVTVNIPATTKSIHSQSFIFCPSLLDINVDKENKWYATSDGMLCNKAKTKLLAFPGGKANEKFTLLSPSFTEIGDSAFYDCRNLKSIVIPKKVTKIGEYAFRQCKDLQKIFFLGDEPVATIDQKAFGYQFDTDKMEEADFLKKNVAITIRKNGKESMYDTDSHFKDSQKSLSFIDEDNMNEYLPTGNGDALLLKSYSKNYSTVIPATISDGTNTYKVNVGDYAFEDIDESVKEIIFEGPVEYMGACAFKDFEGQTTNIENVILTDYQSAVGELSTNRFDLPEDIYQTINTAQHMYVAKSLEADYKENWASHADEITYKIPGIKIGTKYGTFSREFDVDLCDKVDGEYANYDTENKRPYIAAFTGYIATITPYEWSDYTFIRMRSINCTSKKDDTDPEDGDGTYIPKNTGVLLCAYTEDEKTPDGFYYRIGEQKGTYDDVQVLENVMMTVTENGRHIDAKEGDYTNYVISGGQYKPLGEAGVDMPVHKSYMHILEKEGSKGIKVIFGGEDEDATSIEDININGNDNENEVFYNLQGQRVNGNVKGIVIKNGKKHLVK